MLQTKLDFLDPYMRGPLIKSKEIDDDPEKVRVLYIDEEKEEISEEVREFFLSCDEDLEILKDKAAKYG